MKFYQFQIRSRNPQAAEEVALTQSEACQDTYHSTEFQQKDTFDAYSYFSLQKQFRRKMEGTLTHKFGSQNLRQWIKVNCSKERIISLKMTFLVIESESYIQQQFWS